MTKNFKPHSFDDFVGQDKVKQILQILCQSALKQDVCVPHFMLAGPPGLGKTTLARIVASEMDSRLIEIVAGNLQKPSDILRHVLELRPRDILFIDEIHGLPRDVEEVLYGAMEDFRVPTSMMTLDVQPFTCVGATTLSGLVSAPLRSRFVQILNLEPYSSMELQSIVMNMAVKTGFELEPEIAFEIAVRSRNTARIALGNLRWFFEFCNGKNVLPDMDAVKQSFALKGLDDHGLTQLDRVYLTALVESPHPMGLSTLVAITGENKNNLANTIEPFLVKQGYVQTTGRGRIATEKARQVILGNVKFKIVPTECVPAGCA